MSGLLLLGGLVGLVLLLPVMQQPLSAGFMVLMISVFCSVFLGFCVASWYGFALFLVYVGGLLVMFGYVVVLIPNFSFSLSGGVSFFSLTVFLFGLIGSFFGGENLDGFDLPREGVVEFGGFLFCDWGFFMFLGLGSVLFLALVCVVKICYFHSGSLRPFSAN